MSDTDPIIRVENLRAEYSGRVVLKDISFSVKRGEIFVILGPSGCGKSTLLKHMIGLYRPASGRVLLEGEDICQAEGKQLRAILQHIGVTYQSGALFGSMTLLENVRLPLEEFTGLPPEAMEAIARLRLASVGLAGFAEALPSQISGGMQKRAALARAMVLDPPVLFLDEPSAGFDPITSADFDALIERLNDELGLTFVIVTHELPSIYALADRVIMLDNQTKTIIAEGEPAKLRDESDIPLVRQFFHRKSSRRH